MAIKSKKHTEKVPEEVVNLIKCVEEEFYRFINFALGEKNKKKENYYGIDGERFKTLFMHWKKCTEKNKYREDYFLTPEKINKNQTKKSSDVKGAVQKSPPRIRKLLKTYYSPDNNSSYQPDRKIEIAIESRNTGGLYRFRVAVDGKGSIDFISKFQYNDTSSSTNTPYDLPSHSDYDYEEQLSDAERLLNDNKTILEAIRKYQRLVFASDEFHSEIIESIVLQIKIRAEYENGISSVYPKLSDIDQPPHGTRKVVENLFKLLAKNFKNFKCADRLFSDKLYLSRMDLRRIHFSNGKANQDINCLKYAQFNGCNIGWTSFNYMDLTGANFADIICSRAALFKETNLKDVNFWNADLRYMNHDPITGKLINPGYNKDIFLDVKTMYKAKLDDDLKQYLMEKKPSLFDPCPNPK
jgi:hypothetical protein